MENIKTYLENIDNNTINNDISSLKGINLDIEVLFKTICDISRDAVIVMSARGKVLYCNTVYFSFSGYSTDEIIGKHFLRIPPLIYSELPKILKVFYRLLKGETVRGFTFRFKIKSGQILSGETDMAPVRSGRKIAGVIGIIKATDIKENSLKDNTAKEDDAAKEGGPSYKTLVDKMFEGKFILDSRALITSVSPQIAVILGYETHEIIGKPFIEFIDENSKLDVTEILFNGNGNNSNENIIAFKRKDRKEAFMQLAIIHAAKNSVSPGIVLYARDMTGKTVADKERILKDCAIDSSMNAIAILDLSYSVTYANESFVKLFGYKNKNDVIGRKATEFIIFDDSFQIDAAAVFENGSASGEGKGIKPEGTVFDIEQYANVVKKDGKPLAIMLLIIDITAKKREAERIKYLSFHDGLTGLYNRAYFEEELKRLDTPRQLPLSFIIGDLNSLKLVNDSYGHRFGDTMITRAAKIIRKYCRDEDVIARWGGDEFVILLPKTDGPTTESIIERIRKACEVYTYRKTPLSIALGSATKALQDESMNTVIKNAEEIMYKRKMLERKSISGSIILSLEATLSEKSFETKEHAERLKKLAVKMGKKLNLPENQIGDLSLLATLHDIGKVAIPESILAKEGNLNKKEWELIRRHPEIGSNIASSSPQISHIANAILAAHEYWDGSGYPKGVKGEDIPLISRLIHIIDAYDVMRSGRPYKKPVKKAIAIKELRLRSGEQFDPVLVEEFISMIGQ